MMLGGTAAIARFVRLQPRVGTPRKSDFAFRRTVVILHKFDCSLCSTRTDAAKSAGTGNIVRGAADLISFNSPAAVSGAPERAAAAAFVSRIEPISMIKSTCALDQLFSERFFAITKRKCILTGTQKIERLVFFNVCMIYITQVVLYKHKMYVLLDSYKQRLRLQDPQKKKKGREISIKVRMISEKNSTFNKKKICYHT